MNIGFIGTGIMGLPMAKHLLNAGHQLSVNNRTASKAQPLVDMGAVLCHSPADTAIGADIVICIVSRTEDVQQVLLGEQGAVNTAAKGTLFMDMSTIDVAATKGMAQALQAKGMRFMDAPVSGGEVGAVNAALTIFCGASLEDFEAATPVLNAMGKKLNHMGDVGAGQATKACNQILVSSALLGVCEALSLGVGQGLDLSKVVTATGGGAGQSWQLDSLGKAIAENDFAPGFMVELLHKDLKMIIDSQNPQQLPASSEVLQRLEVLLKNNQGKQGTQAMYQTFLNDDQ